MVDAGAGNVLGATAGGSASGGVGTFDEVDGFPLSVRMSRRFCTVFNPIRAKSCCITRSKIHIGPPPQHSMEVVACGPR